MVGTAEEAGRERVMIVEARCNECGERIGYISINAHLKTKYIKTIRDGNAYVELLCDDCREGRLDLDEGEADD